MAAPIQVDPKLEALQPRSQAGPRALLVLNRGARRGKTPLDPALEVLGRAGFQIEQLGCDDAAAIRAAIAGRRDEVDCVIVAGGDGTLNCCAQLLLHTDLPLGILPLGTANDFARTLGIAPDLALAAEVIAAGGLRSIDLGEVNGHVFFNVSSIGFPAEVARELTVEAKRRWGVFGYALASAKLLLRTQPFTAHIEHDGVTEKVKTVQISVGNGRYYGGGMMVDETAEPDDGKLHVFSLEVGHWSRLLALAPALRRGKQASERDVRAFATEGLTVRTRKPRAVNTDGELTTLTPATYRVIPAAIRVFAPLQTPARAVA